MKTRPKPPLTLRQIWEKPDDYGSDKVFTSLAIGLENTDHNLDYLASDLAEETEQRMEDRETLKHMGVFQFEEYIGQQNSEIREIESDLTEETARRVEDIKALQARVTFISASMVSKKERLEAVEARQSEAVYMRDMPEILADICNRLDRLERSVHLLKFPEMLKG